MICSLIDGHTLPKKRAPHNRTIVLNSLEQKTLRQQLCISPDNYHIDSIKDQIIQGDATDILQNLPDKFIDLLIIDPPYNMSKRFGKRTFRQKSDEAYQAWADSWLKLMIPLLTPSASVYICAEWRTSSLLYPLLQDYFVVRNRITWEREKGRGAKQNWKNTSEDIWFCTVGNNYTFNSDQVKLTRRILAPYRQPNGDPKDWTESTDGKYRLTFPSNLWTDISVPFWSMPENTDHPTQKPEKLIAKLILASSNPGDIVFDPFLGSGTTAVVAKKLNRHFVGIELDEQYACLALKRLQMAENDRTIQGYDNGVFWERNTLHNKRKS